MICQFGFQRCTCRYSNLVERTTQAAFITQHLLRLTNQNAHKLGQIRPLTVFRWSTAPVLLVCELSVVSCDLTAALTWALAPIRFKPTASPVQENSAKGEEEINWIVRWPAASGRSGDGQGIRVLASPGGRGVERKVCGGLGGCATRPLPSNSPPRLRLTSNKDIREKWWWFSS